MSRHVWVASGVAALLAMGVIIPWRSHRGDDVRVPKGRPPSADAREPFVGTALEVEVVREGAATAPAPVNHQVSSDRWGPLTTAENRDVEDRLAALRGRALGPRKFQAALQEAARSDDLIAIRVVLKLADDLEAELPALEALGLVRYEPAYPDVAAKLHQKLSAASPAVRAAALNSFARIAGDAAIPDAERFIREGWQAGNGHELEVCLEGVRALGQIRSEAGLRALASILKGGARPDWLPDFGSAVIATLASSVQSYEPDGAGSSGICSRVLREVEGYAADLDRKRPGADNPPGRAYIEDKIAEADSLATMLRARGTH